MSRREPRSRLCFTQLLGAAAAAMVAISTFGTPASAQTVDNSGTEFILGFMQNVPRPHPLHSLVLFITGDTATTGNVDIPGLGFSQTFSVTPGTISTVNLPSDAAVAGSDIIQNKGVLVTAEDPVVVYGLNQITQTTDAFLGLPTDVLGTEHIILGFGQAFAGVGSEFAVVGVENGTIVTIIPSVTTGARMAGESFVVTLNALDVYQLQTNAVSGDLSGTIVTSDKPVAVFGGNRCAQVPVGTNFCDHLVEQLPPTSTWGTSFLTVSLATRTGGDLFRVIARDDGTQVFLDGVSQGTINRAEFMEFDLPSGGVHEISTSGPALLMQYAKGSQADNVTPAAADPFMMMIPPSEQFLSGYTLTTPAASPVSFTNFINVVVRTDDIVSCTIDGEFFMATFTPIGASGFSGAQEPVGIGAHVLSCPNPFGAYAYGFAFVESYGYPGGMALAPVANVSNIQLTPESDSNPVGDEHCVTALVTDQDQIPVEGVRVDFSVTGVNPVDGFANTNAEGKAQFCYTGDEEGHDTIVAAVGAVTSDPATKTWTSPVVVTTIQLAPKTATNDVGTEHCVVATVLDQHDDPVADVPVSFMVTGANSAAGSAGTNAQGQAGFCYTGNIAGEDAIVASVNTISDTASKTWTEEPVVVVATLELDPETATHSTGTEHCVVATVSDQNNNPVQGEAVGFTVAGANFASGSAITNAQGQATFCYTGSNPGQDTIVASVDTISDISGTAETTWTEEVGSACPHSQGFWKNHPNAWPVDYLALGSKRYSKDQLLKILKTPVRGDASLILAYQLIAAKLNIEHGSDPAPISDTIDYADKLIESKKVPQKVSPASASGKKMTSVASILDRYNNGKLTPDCIRSKKTAQGKKKLKLPPLPMKDNDKGKNKGHALQKIKNVKEKVKGLAVGLKKKEIKPITIIKPKSRGK